MKKINVELKNKAYTIFIGNGIFPYTVNRIKKIYTGKKIFVVIDENFYSLWKNIINKYLPQNRFVIHFILPSGERSKSNKSIEQIYSHLLNKQVGRDGLIIAIGGGVTGDTAGYAAASFMRGIDFIQIPTTLLAAVDSSIGGKTGINFGKKKNIIGAFHQPKAVYVDTDFLKSLPPDEIVSGLGEVVKYAFLSNTEFFNYINKNLSSIFEMKNGILEQVIHECISFKAGVVIKDEKETGSVRKILNLGHTFAHAFESELNFSINHGTAVLAGLISSSFLSNSLNILPDKQLAEYLFLLKNFNFPRKLLKISNNSLYEAMLNDKKNRDGKIKFILSAGFGKTLTDIEAEQSMIFKILDQTKSFIEENSLTSK